MAYEVKVQTPEGGLKLARADVLFPVKKNRAAFGTLKASQGALVWRPRNRQIGRKITWRDFDEWMREAGTPER
jgi:hypothetical protein